MTPVREAPDRLSPVLVRGSVVDPVEMATATTTGGVGRGVYSTMLAFPGVKIPVAKRTTPVIQRVVTPIRLPTKIRFSLENKIERPPTLSLERVVATSCI